MKKIISFFTLLFFLFSSYGTSIAADTTTTVIEGTNINVTSTSGTSGGGEDNSSNTSTVDNSVSISGAGSAMSTFIDQIFQQGFKYETGDYNGDNLPDVIVYKEETKNILLRRYGGYTTFAGQILEFYEYSKVGNSYVLSYTLNSAEVLKYLSEEFENPNLIVAAVNPGEELIGHPEASIRTNPISLDASINGHSFIKDSKIFFTKDENGKNRALISIGLTVQNVTYSENARKNTAFVNFKGITENNCNLLKLQFGTNLNFCSSGPSEDSYFLKYNLILETTQNVSKMKLNYKGSSRLYTSWSISSGNLNTPYDSITKNIASSWSLSPLETETDGNSDNLNDLFLFKTSLKNPTEIQERYIFDLNQNRYIEDGTIPSDGGDNLGIDVNNDTLEDAVFFTDANDTGTLKNLAVYINDNGNYKLSLNATNITGMTFIDLNNDDNSIDKGAKDIIVHTKVGETFKYQVYAYDKTTLTYNNILNGTSFLNGLSFITSDINSDGLLDITFSKNDGNTYIYTFDTVLTGSMKLLTTINGGDYRYIDINNDGNSDLITRDYLGVFSGNKFYEYKIYFYNSATQQYDLKNNIQILAKTLNVWDNKDLRDFNLDGVIDIISDGNNTKNLFYFNGTEYKFLDKIRQTENYKDFVSSEYIVNSTIATDTVPTNNKIVTLLDNNGYLKVYDYNEISKEYFETTKVYYNEEFKNQTLSTLELNTINKPKLVKFTDPNSFQQISDQNGEYVSVLRDNDGTITLINDFKVGNDNYGRIFINNGAGSESLSNAQTLKKLFSIKEESDTLYTYVYTDDKISYGFSENNSKFLNINEGLKSSQISNGFIAPVLYYNGKFTGISNSASIVEKNKASFLAEKYANRNLQDDFLVVQKIVGLSKLVQNLLCNDFWTTSSDGNAARRYNDFQGLSCPKVNSNGRTMPILGIGPGHVWTPLSGTRIPNGYSFSYNFTKPTLDYTFQVLRFVSFQNKKIQDYISTFYENQQFSTFVNFISIENYVDFDNFQKTNQTNYTYNVSGTLFGSNSENVSCQYTKPYAQFGTYSCTATSTVGTQHLLSQVNNDYRTQGLRTISQTVQILPGGNNVTITILDKNGNIENGRNFTLAQGITSLLSKTEQEQFFLLIGNYDYNKKIDYNQIKNVAYTNGNFSGTNTGVNGGQDIRNSRNNNYWNNSRPWPTNIIINGITFNITPQVLIKNNGVDRISSIYRVVAGNNIYNSGDYPITCTSFSRTYSRWFLSSGCSLNSPLPSYYEIESGN